MVVDMGERGILGSGTSVHHLLIGTTTRADGYGSGCTSGTRTCTNKLASHNCVDHVWILRCRNACTRNVNDE